MIDLLHKGLHRGHVGARRLIGNQVGKVLDAYRLAGFVQVFAQELFQLFRHPDDAPDTAFRGDELTAGDVGFAYAHEAGHLLAAAGRVRHGGELHAGRGLAQVLAVDDHDPVGFRHQGHDGLKAAAAGHGIFQQGIGVEARQGLLGVGVDVVVDVGPLPRTGSMYLPLISGWLGPVGSISQAALPSSQL